MRRAPSRISQNCWHFKNWGQSGFTLSTTTKRLRSGGTFTLHYDGLERLSWRQDPVSSANDIYYTYDLVGDVLGIGYGSPTSPALSFTWDALGRKLSETSFGHALSSAYDAAGNRTRLTYPDSNYIDYSYDLLNRMYQVRENGGSILAEYSYDDLNRILGIRRSNGDATTASYGGDQSSILGFYAIDLKLEPAREVFHANLEAFSSNRISNNHIAKRGICHLSHISSIAEWANCRRK